MVTNEKFVFRTILLLIQAILSESAKPIVSPKAFEWPKEDPQYELSKNYSKFEVPPSNGPLEIKASWNLRSIIHIDEESQSLRFDATLRFEWKDSRIIGIPDKGEEYVTLTPRSDAGDETDIISKIWMPDFFVDQGMDINQDRIFLEAASVR